MWTEFAGFLFCSERFFSGNSGFPLSSKERGKDWLKTVFCFFGAF